MPTSARSHRWLLLLVPVLYLALAAWHASQGRLAQAGFETLIAAGFGLILTAPDQTRGPRVWLGSGLLVAGILGQIIADA